MLRNREYARIHGSLFNLLLVLYGGRKAFLLETVNFIGTEYAQDILNIASDIGLYKTDDILSLEDHPRYWITKGKLDKIPETREEIGELLGMKNPGGEFYDYTKKRLILDIYEEMGGDITTELLSGDIEDEDNKLFAKNKTRSFNKVMKSLNLPYKFVYHLQQDDGSDKRLKELERRNIDYIRKNMNQYKSDIGNCINRYDDSNPIIDLFQRSISIYENNKELFNKFFPLFIYILKVLIDEVGESPDFESKIEDIHNKFIDLIELNLK
jgi:hypothetical protein